MSDSFTPWTVAQQAPRSMRTSRARTLEWVAIPFCRGSSQMRDPTHMSCIGRWVLYHWVTREAPIYLGCSVTKLCPNLWPHELQHARLLCPPLSLRVCSNSCPLSHRCYLTISSSALIPLSKLHPLSTKQDISVANILNFKNHIKIVVTHF